MKGPSAFPSYIGATSILVRPFVVNIPQVTSLSVSSCSEVKPRDCRLPSLLRMNNPHQLAPSFRCLFSIRHTSNEQNTVYMILGTITEIGGCRGTGGSLVPEFTEGTEVYLVFSLLGREEVLEPIPTRTGYAHCLHHTQIVAYPSI